MRARLREAAVRLTGEPGRVLDVFNFNRAFRAEFGVNPRAYRTQAGGGARSRAARG